MTRSFLFAALALSVTLLVPVPEAGANGMRARPRAHPHWHHRHFRLLPERHVVEINKPTYGGYYTFNGAGFSAMTASCARWAAGERVRLLAGDWNAACTTAVFYNMRRRQACEMRCR
jgi:hypothetical protein